MYLTHVYECIIITKILTVLQEVAVLKDFFSWFQRRKQKLILSPQEKIDVIVFARNIVARPDGFCHGCFSADASGLEVDIDSPDAVQFCIRGGISLGLRRVGVLNWRPMHGPEEELSKKICAHLGLQNNDARYLGDWNNSHDQGYVVASLDLLIEKLRVQQGEDTPVAA